MALAGGGGEGCSEAVLMGELVAIFAGNVGTFSLSILLADDCWDPSGLGAKRGNLAGLFDPTRHMAVRVGVASVLWALAKERLGCGSFPAKPMDLCRLDRGKE